jgi:hypothetical protein
MRLGVVRADERHHANVKNFLGVFRRLMFERGDAAPVGGLDKLCCEKLGQIVEFEFSAAVAGPAEELARCFVGVKDGQVAAHDQASAAEFTQDVAHHLVMAASCRATRYSSLPCPVLRAGGRSVRVPVGDGFARDSSSKAATPNKVSRSRIGHGYFGAEQFKFFLHFSVLHRFAAFPAQDPAGAEQVPADAVLEGEFEVFE